MFLVKPKLLGKKFPATGMLVVVTIDLGVAFEADRNRVIDDVVAAFLLRDEVVSLHLDIAKPVTNAAPTVTASEELGHLIAWECHIGF